MNEPNNLIQRQGFEAWADNIIVNAIEELGTTPFEYVAEENDVTVHIRLQDGSVSATVRAYVPCKGWQYHDRVIKMGKSK